MRAGSSVSVMVAWDWPDLGQDAIDRWHANEAAGDCHDAQQQEVVVVGGGLLQPELWLLRHLGRDRVIKEEEQRDDHGRQQGCAYVGSWHPPQILRQRWSKPQGRQPTRLETNERHCIGVLMPPHH